ncbi:glycoside hydrolase family 18 protein [Patellaria atrata CBS 101060]|uniref:chitinase n=1 Tax=Patellaria atrata CBS 101060 TaxID=1346257 RepID=A0A9P4SH17_9PEZI|nr:glycoside hydrolase family 18 protein [Patellaria atrata CBS 101060]
MFLQTYFPVAATAVTLFQTALAGYNPSAKNNVAVYWGQNSYGQGSGNLAQQRLSNYCSDSNIDIIIMSFLVQIKGTGGQPVMNFANQGDRCTVFPGTSTFNCPEIAADIKTCQSRGKTILLSIGGATYTEGGFASAADATSAAQMIWQTFGPRTSSSALRPFGDSYVNGIDFDFEAGVRNMVPFGQRLRTLMNASGSGFLITGAPQCPYPDYAMGEMLAAGGVAFDVIWPQFYNNYCGLQSYVSGAADQWNFNFNTWDQWARQTSVNRNVKVMLGTPAGPSAAGSGYTGGDRLREIIGFVKKFERMGGVMMWDVSQAYANSGFLVSVKNYLNTAREATREAVRAVAFRA